MGVEVHTFSRCLLKHCTMSRLAQALHHVKAAACSSTAPCQGMKEKESFIMKEKEMKEDQHIST
jgi:hypothetical protein